jgi:hypothetical protein|uniref:Uncharacterized protein n=1 Tax=uncultured Caudovirales phage TaxID=2100421 RepID=A0A6J5KZI3_9CAUD|nr:hypothetical protein UFOVP88_26 [uncultured Caudovirales phage]
MSSPANSEAPFLPTTRVFPEDFKKMIYVLNESYTRIANCVNAREISQYLTDEILTGQVFTDITDFSNFKPVFRTIYYIGAISAGSTSTTAHGLSNITQFTNIYGTAVTSAPDNRPIPYADTSNVNNQISITVDSTNINITNGSTAPNITSAIVVLEYLKS